MMPSCPFCGETEEIKVVTRPRRFDRLDGTWDVMTLAYVQCGHCAARGASVVEGTRAEAIRGATQYWDEAGRPSWWHMNVRRPWLTFCNDVREFMTGGYDRRAVLRDIWGWIRR